MSRLNNYFFSLIILLRLMCLVTATFNSSHHDKLIGWVRTKGGYWNPKQEVKSQDGIHGVFAAEDIREGERLASIPWSAVITVPHMHNRFDNCDIVERLATEIKKGDKSYYSLYLQELVGTAKQHLSVLPSYWSTQGQELLLNITGDSKELPPSDPFLLKSTWKKKCEGISKEATLLVMTHGENFGMVPITDKYNSRGGNYTGAYFTMEGKDDVIALEIQAFRNMKAGEQIFTDYRDYGKIGTAELLKDYGFVEFYPQRWFFSKKHVAFDIIDDGNLKIHWHKKKKYKLKNPTHGNTRFQQNTLKFFRGQLERLETSVHPILLQQLAEGHLPEHESQTIHQFYTDLTTALKLAIDDINKALGRKNHKHEELRKDLTGTVVGTSFAKNYVKMQVVDTIFIIIVMIVTVLPSITITKKAKYKSRSRRHRNDIVNARVKWISPRQHCSSSRGT